MLGKLLRYENKAYLRVFLPIFAALIALAATNRICYALTENMDASVLHILRALLLITYILVVIGIAAFCFFFGISRFWKNLLGAEGSLSFTLPVPTSALIFSKLIPAMLWGILSIAAIGISVLLIVPDPSFFPLAWDTFLCVLEDARTDLGIAPFSMCLFIALIALTGAIAFFFGTYAAMCIGQLSNNHRILFSFVAYIGIYFVEQFVNLCLLFLSFPAELLFGTGPQVSAIVIFLLEIGVQLLFSVLLYFLTHYLLKHRLNLE